MTSDWPFPKVKLPKRPKDKIKARAARAMHRKMGREWMKENLAKAQQARWGTEKR